MRSITIHGMDETLAKHLQKQARVQGLSLNRTIKQLLRRALGITGVKEAQPKNDFREYIGVWTKREAQEFDKHVRVFEKIDADDWQ